MDNVDNGMGAPADAAKVAAVFATLNGVKHVHDGKGGGR